MATNMPILKGGQPLNNSNVNQPVLVGNVPLFCVQQMTIQEGYKIESVAKSRFYQALAPVPKTITIQAMLIGPERQVIKKGLEIIALTSRLLVASIGPVFSFSGVAVVSSLTISLNMMITSLTFTQGVNNRDEIDVNITLQQVPAVQAMASSLNLVLGSGNSLVSSGPKPGSVAREVGGALPKS